MSFFIINTAVPKFANDDTRGLYLSLKQEINDYFYKNRLSKRGGIEVTVKTIVLFIIFVCSYTLLISEILPPPLIFLSGLTFGLSQVLIVFNVGHDAAHNALFKTAWLNRLFSYTFNMVGTSSYLWNLTHNRIHHTYPNVAEIDPDIHQQAPLIRVSPSVELKWYHRYQPYYATFIYLFYSLFLVFLKDYQDFKILPKIDSRLLESANHKAKQYLIFFLSKSSYYAYTIVIPFLLIEVSLWQFVAGYLGIHFCMSLLLAAVLIPVHMVDESEFANVDNNNSIHDTWTIHVIKNTTDYSRKSKIANLLFGGLNTHMVHHLFPHVCHIHYIKMSEILKDTIEKYDIKYNELTMMQAICSHYRLLKRMAR